MRRALSMLLFVPASAFAMQSLMWNFTSGDLQGWINQGLDSVQVSSLGMNIQTQIDGQLRRDLDQTGFDAITITYTAVNPQEFLVLWQGNTETEARGIPLQVIASNVPNSISVSLASIEGWNPHTKRLGFQFSQGAAITIQSIELQSWNMFEKLWYGIKSPWKFDSVYAYTINFLWGPLIVTNPVAIDRMYMMQPPSGRSANTVIYVVLAVILFVLLYMSHGESHAKRVRVLQKFFIVFAFCWVLYDIRMGAELLSFVKKDYDTFYSQTPENQVYRDRAFFIQFVEAIKPVLEGKDNFVFLPFMGYPYMGSMRYLTYPSNPVDLTHAPTEPGTVWVIFGRSTVKMDENGQLMENGQVISPAGKILHEFGPGTFVFQTN